jgi:alanyl-tRNA synthetase
MFVDGIEIWNDVFMEYEKTKEGKYIEAKQKNIDTGMGVERVLAILNNLKDNYETEIWKPLIEEIEKLSNKKYSENKKEMRIIADHIKASCFIINDRIVPGNTEHGYVLRRLIRVAIRNLKKLEINLEKANIVSQIAKKVYEIYPEYNLNKEKISKELKRKKKNL